jgi:hypothetical protein
MHTLAVALKTDYFDARDRAYWTTNTGAKSNVVSDIGKVKPVPFRSSTKVTILLTIQQAEPYTQTNTSSET